MKLVLTLLVVAATATFADAVCSNFYARLELYLAKCWNRNDGPELPNNCENNNRCNCLSSGNIARNPCDNCWEQPLFNSWCSTLSQSEMHSDDVHGDCSYYPIQPPEYPPGCIEPAAWMYPNQDGDCDPPPVDGVDYGGPRRDDEQWHSESSIPPAWAYLRRNATVRDAELGRVAGKVDLFTGSKGLGGDPVTTNGRSSNPDAPCVQQPAQCRSWSYPHEVKARNGQACMASPQNGGIPLSSLCPIGWYWNMPRCVY
jgi:hypothetical protein